MITIERIEDPAAFEFLRDEWDALLEASASKCLFLAWEWLYTWWQHLSEGRGLCLLTVRRDGRLVAIAPFMISPPRVARLVPFASLEFLGTGSVGSDYLDLIVRAGQEEAMGALAAYLADRRVMVQLAQVRPNSSLAALAARMTQHGWTWSTATTDVCPFIALSRHSWQSYLATLGPEHRYNLQRRLRNLTKQFDVRFEHARSEQERREFLSLLLGLHNRRWGDRGGSTAFHSRGLLAFHEELTERALARGWLRLFVLWLDGKPAASLYGFRYGSVFYFYQCGFDPAYRKHGVGMATLALTIKHAIEEGAKEYDLLHGDEPYKSHWAREVRELGRVELYPPHLRGWLYQHAVEASRAARRAARRVLPETVYSAVTGRAGEARTASYATDTP